MARKKTGRKIYIHINGGSDGIVEHSFVMYCDDSSDNIESAKIAFLSDYIEENPDISVNRSPDQYILRSSNNARELTEQTWGRLKNKSDVYIELVPFSTQSSVRKQVKQKEKVNKKAETFAPAPVEKEKTYKTKEKEKKKQTNLSIAESGNTVLLTQMARRHMSTAEQYHKQGNLRKAIEFYKEALGLFKMNFDEESSVSCQTARSQLGIILFAAKKYERAIKYLQKVKNGWKKEASDKNQEASDKNQEASDKDQEASDKDQEASDKDQEASDKALRYKLHNMLAQSYFFTRDYFEAENTFDEILRDLKPRSEYDPYEIHLLQVWKARALIGKGDVVQAVTQLKHVLGEDSGFVPAMTYFSKIATGQKQYTVVIPFLYNCVIADQSRVDKPTKKLISLMITDAFLDVGVPGFLEHLDSKINNPSIFAHLGNIIKENSAIPESLILFEKSMQPNLKGPEKANRVINFVYTLELIFRYQDALHWIQDFMKQNVSFKVGDLPIGTFYEIIKNIDVVGTPDMMDGTAECEKWVNPPDIFDADKIQVKVPGSGEKVEEKKNDVAKKM